MTWDCILFIIFGSLFVLVSIFCYVYTVLDLFKKWNGKTE